MSDGPSPATPEADAGPGTPASPGSRVRPLRAAGLGALAALVLFGTGLVIATLEYVATGGRYRAWTWVKVAILYALSFCGVGIRASVRAGGFAAGSPALDVAYRLPLLLGASLFVWLLFRAGRGLAHPGQSPMPFGLAIAAVVVGAALPLFLASFLVSLRLPEVGNVVVTMVPWEAAAFPLLVAAASVTGGAYAGWRERAGRRRRVEMWLEGGWRMLTTALALAFLGFVVVAAVNPAATGRYARSARDAGRTGAVVVLHHLLLLPAQTMLSLAPAMGGQVQVEVAPDAGVTALSIRRISPSPAAGVLFGRAADGAPIPLGDAWYAFLLVPAAASVVGGRSAGRSDRGALARATDGAGAGVVFCVMVTGGCAFATTVLPLLSLGFAPVRIATSMGTTALLALMWGVAGGVVGALTSGSPATDQTPVPDPGPGDEGPETFTSV